MSARRTEGSLRNRLIHGYDAVDFDLLWEILTCKSTPDALANSSSCYDAGDTGALS